MAGAVRRERQGPIHALKIGWPFVVELKMQRQMRETYKSVTTPECRRCILHELETFALTWGNSNTSWAIPVRDSPRT